MKILVIQTAFPGDAILTLPLIQELSKKYETKIDVISNPVTSKIFDSSPYIGNVIELDKRGTEKSIYSIIRFASEIRKFGYDKIFSPHRSFRSSLIVALSGCKETYGFSNSSLKFVYKNIVKYEIDLHETARNLKLGGFETRFNQWKIFPEIKINNELSDSVKKFLNQRRLNSFIIIAPGSVWETKKYPESSYVKISKFLIEKGKKIVLTGSSDDFDLCDRISNKIGKDAINTAGFFSIPGTIELLKYSDLLICNDSAPTHMAMAANAKVLTLYCSTVPKFGFYPYSDKSYYLSFEKLDCKPCGIHGHKKCPIGTFECAEKLSPDKVISKVEEIISS